MNSVLGSAIEGDRLRPVSDLLAGAANHEAKAALLACIAMQPEGVAHTRFSMRDDFHRMQGPNPVWKFESPALATDYAEKSYVPVGAVARVEEGGTDNLVSTRYYVTRSGRHEGFAAAGLGMDYSLRYRDLSLYQMIGATQSKSQNGVRAPETRIRLLDKLVALGGVATQFYILAEGLDTCQGSALNQVRSLHHSGILDVNGGHRNADSRMLEIVDADALLSLKLDQHSREMRLFLHAMVRDRVSRGNLSIPLQYIRSNFVDAFAGIDTNQRYARINKYLELLERLELGIVVSETAWNERTKIEIRKEKVEAVNDYLFFVLGLAEMDAGLIEFGKERAKQIIGNEHDVRYLLAKASAASPNRNAESYQMGRSRVHSILSDGNWHPVSDIVEQFQLKGKQITVTGARRILESMNESRSLRKVIVRGRAYYAALEQAAA